MGLGFFPPLELFLPTLCCHAVEIIGQKSGARERKWCFNSPIKVFSNCNRWNPSTPPRQCRIYRKWQLCVARTIVIGADSEGFPSYFPKHPPHTPQLCLCVCLCVRLLVCLSIMYVSFLFLQHSSLFFSQTYIISVLIFSNFAFYLYFVF